MLNILAPFTAVPPLTTAVAPIPGQISRYNASAGPLSPALLPLSVLTVGAVFQIEKDELDTSTNVVTLSCFAGDTFESGVSTKVLTVSSQWIKLVVVAINGTKFWAVEAQGLGLAALDVRYSGIAPITGSMYPLSAYGAKGDGVTDDTAAVNAAIVAAMAAGGTITANALTYLCLGAIIIPYTGPAAAPVQKPLRIAGAGATSNGYWSGAPINGGTVFDLRYSGADALHPAKIDTRGAGFLEIERITFTSGGTDNLAFFQTTNTTCSIHECAFIGNLANSGTSCIQDAIVFGGSSNNATVGSGPTAPFQGYGGKVRGNYFGHIRRGFLGQAYCNSITIEGNTWSTTCGSSTGGAIELNGSATAGYVTGNRTVGNTIEVSSYLYGISCTYGSLNNFGPDGFYDPAAAHLAAIYLDPNSQYNTVIDGFRDDNYALVLETGRTTTIQTGHQSQASLYPQPQRWIQNTPHLAINNGGAGIWAAATDGCVATLSAFTDAFPYHGAAIVTAPPIQISDFSTVAGSPVVTSASAAWQVLDVGMPIKGAGVPAGAITIQSRQSATQVTMTANATATGSGGVATFGRGVGTTTVVQARWTRQQLITQGTVGACSVSGNAGVGASATATGTDMAWTLVLTTGTTPAGGAQAVIAAHFNWSAPAKMSLTPKNAAAASAMASAGIFITNDTANAIVTSVTALPASTRFVFDAIAIQ